MKNTGSLTVGLLLLALHSATANAQPAGGTFPWNSTFPTDIQITPTGSSSVNTIVFGAQNSAIEAPVTAIFCADSGNGGVATFYQRIVVGTNTLWETIRLSPGQCKSLSTKDLFLRRTVEALRGTFTLN